MAAEFPSITAGGAQHLKLLRFAPSYSVIEKEFKDRGRNYGLLSANTVLEWEYTFDGLTAAEAAVFDAHYVDAQGSFEGFNFRDPQTTTLYSDVHYVSYEVDHTKVWSQSRRIRLRKSPV